MSIKSSRGCKYVCTEKNCTNTWFTGSKEPSRFAKKWPGTCEKCEKRLKTERERVAKENKEKEEKEERERAAKEKKEKEERERVAKEEKEKEEKEKEKENALISKRNEVEEAKVKLHRRKFEAEKEFLKMKLEFYKSAPEKAPEDKEVQEKVFKIIEELKPFAEPKLEPEKFSTQPVTAENYHEQMREAEMRLENIKMLEKGFEANQEISIWKLDTYKGMKMNVALLDKISNLKIPGTAPQGAESPPTLRL